MSDARRAVAEAEREAIQQALAWGQWRLGAPELVAEPERSLLAALDRLSRAIVAAEGDGG